MSEIKKVLTNGPPSVILFQVQYSPIVQIEEYIPVFQEYMRKNGYPLYHSMEMEIVRAGRHGEPKKAVLEQWIFSSADTQKTIILDSEAITYQAFDAQSLPFDTLLQNFISIVRELDSIVDISLVSRLGLRNINSIQETPNVSWKDLVGKEFQGPLLPTNIQWMENELSVFSMQRGVVLTDLAINSNFKVTLAQNTSGMKYPHGIQCFPTTGPEFYEPKSKVTFLDLDHFVLFTAAPKPEVLDCLFETFHALHSVIEDVFFETMITDKAKKLWQ
ncbi:MAG: TIGR04255 family protein [Sphaerochaeta sp.]|nr:TIGR04255 family protein [Sphaerochaeta sp.]